MVLGTQKREALQPCLNLSLDLFRTLKSMNLTIYTNIKIYTTSLLCSYVDKI